MSRYRLRPLLVGILLGSCFGCGEANPAAGRSDAGKEQDAQQDAKSVDAGQRDDASANEAGADADAAATDGPPLAAAPSQAVLDLVAKFDSKYDASPSSEMSQQFNSGNRFQEFYYVSHWLEGLIQAWCATGKSKYLDSALDWIDVMRADAVPVQGGAYLGWPADTAKYGAEYGTNGVSLWEAFMFRYVASLLRILHQSPELRKTGNYQSRYASLLAFFEKNIWDKWYLKTPDHSEIYRVNAHMASHWARIGMELFIITGDPKYQAVFENISFKGIAKYGSSLRDQLELNPSVPSAYTWHSDWNGSSVQDTSHAGAMMSFISTARNNGKYWTETDVDRFASAFNDVLWVSTTHPISFKEYVDGSGSTIPYHSLDFVGWAQLGRHDQGLQDKLVKHAVAGWFSAVIALNQQLLEDGRPVYPEEYAP